MKPNHNPLTGVAYGYVAARDLHPEVVDELMYGRGAKDHAYESALDEALCAAAKAVGLSDKHDLPQDLAEALEEVFLTNYEQPEEPSVEGMYEGVAYVSSWLGGALNFFIIHSPTVGAGLPASPCVPGAGILQRDGQGSVECYTVPPSWWAEQEVEAHHG